MIEIVSSPRPEDDTTQWPTYHEMLEYLCCELRVPGSPDFHEAVQWVKRDSDRLKASQLPVTEPMPLFPRLVVAIGLGFVGVLAVAIVAILRAVLQ
jgi:hypothetical protein